MTTSLSNINLKNKKHMKIQQVKIKEFKILKNIEQEIAGHDIMLFGDNGVGKSSFTQLIKIALGDQSNIPPNATGEGEILVDKEGKQYTFHVKFKDGKPVVTVTAPDGMKDSRKGALANIVGAIDFDINEFVELSKSDKGRKQQVEIFKSFLDEETKEELARFASNIKANYDSRTETNRMIKDKEALIKQSPLFNRIGIEKFEPVNVDNVYAELKAAQEKNTKIISAQSEARSIGESIAREEAEIKQLSERIEALTLNVSSSKERMTKATKWLSENIITDASEFEFTIKLANDRNNECIESEKLKKDISLVEKLKEEAGELTAKIESEKGAIETAIKDMSSPVEGLMFDEEQLIYNGVPVHSASLSTSEIEELGIRLKIAQNPEGILFIGRAESIGSKRMESIREIAKKLNLQIIGEEVKRGQEKLTIEIMGA